MPMSKTMESVKKEKCEGSNVLNKLQDFAYQKCTEKFKINSTKSESTTNNEETEKGCSSATSEEDSREPPSIEKLGNHESENGCQSSDSNSDSKVTSSAKDLKSCIRNSYQLLSASKGLALSLQLANGSSAKEAEDKELNPSDFTARIKKAFSDLPRKRARCAVESSSDEEQKPSVAEEKDQDEEREKSRSDWSNQKRKRFLLESSDDGSDTDCSDSADDANAFQESEIQRKEMCLSKVTALFPQLDYMELQDVLIKYDWSVDKSIDHLQELVESKHSFRKRKIVIQSDSSDDDNRSGQTSKISDDVAVKGIVFLSDHSDQETNPEGRRHPRKENNSKRKRRRDKHGGDDDGETYLREQEDVYDSDNSDIDDTLTPARKMVLSFYDEAAGDELVRVPGCSRKKADIIIGMRPFKGWVDLVSKFQNGKSVSTDLLNKAKEILHSRKIVTQLMKKCSGLADKMEECVARLMNSSDDEGHLKEQPELLNPEMKLAPYQMLGLNWLILLHQQKVNGILADEMGLGKTIQAIAFLAYLMSEGDDGPHLIVVPASTLDNWVRELRTWWPSVNMLTYRGSLEERRYMRMRILKGREDDFNVLVTTYTMCAGSAEDRSLFKKAGFRYVIFDEAHLLKNMETQRYQYLMKILADRRLLLTGTPLQNNLVELMSLLVFVMPNMFVGKIDHLKNMFTLVDKETSEESRGAFEKDRINQAKNIMKPFILRRLKSEVLDQIPNKMDEIIHCSLAPKQREQYDKLVLKLSREFRNKGEKNESSTGNSGIAMMMQMRRLANHPLLMRYIFTDDILRVMSKLMLKEPSHADANADLIFEDMQVMSDFELHKLCKMYKVLSSYVLEPHHILESGKFIQLDEILEEVKEEEQRVLLFSQFVMVLDIVEEYMEINGLKYVRLDGSTAVAERQELIDRFTNDASISVFLLSTKAGGLGINLTAASVVILHDIDFNPYNDKQAEDRCHRIGQTRSVRIIRLIAEDTIEEGILQSAQRKLKLERDVTSSNSKRNDESNDVASLLKEALGL